MARKQSTLTTTRITGMGEIIRNSPDFVYITDVMTQVGMDPEKEMGKARAMMPKVKRYILEKHNRVTYNNRGKGYRICKTPAEVKEELRKAVMRMTGDYGTVRTCIKFLKEWKVAPISADDKIDLEIYNKFLEDIQPLVDRYTTKAQDKAKKETKLVEVV